MLFKFLKSCKTSKEDYCFVTCENYKKCNFQCPSVKVCWNIALLIRHLESMAAFALQWQSRIIAAETTWPIPKIFAI